MEPKAYFEELLQIEPVYEAGEQFFEPFLIFQYRFQSLHRHWICSRDFIQNHVTILKSVDVTTESAEFFDVFEETAGCDIEFFPKYLRGSTISFSLSLVENLLGSLSKEVAKDIGKEIDLDERPLPYINKHLLWLTRGCGMDIKIDKDVWKSLDAIRELRNRFIHRIDRDIPDDVARVMNEMVSTGIDDEASLTDEFVDVSLVKLGELVKRIELGYREFYETQKC